MILRNYCTIERYADTFTENFMKTVVGPSLSLLTLSNEIANRLGHSRYMESPEKWHEDIDVPDAKTTKNLSDAVKFSKEEMDSILKAKRLDSVLLYPFITKIGDARFKETDVNDNPLLTKPLVAVDNEIVVMVPVAITSALRHFIVMMSKKFGKMEFLAEKYRNALWDDIDDYLHSMRFEQVDTVLPAIDKNLPVRDGLYRIDTDKLAYVHLIADDLKDYTNDEPYGIWNSEGLSEKIDERRENIAKWLIKQKKLQCKQVFLITVIGGVGRFIQIGLNSTPDQSRTLIIPVDELRVVSQLGDCDSLALWKYAGAKDRFTATTHLIVSDFLNLYSFYREYHHSFCFTDDKLPDSIFIIPEYSRTLTSQAARKVDIHSATGGNPPQHVIVRRHPVFKDIPIYLPEGTPYRLLNQLVEGYEQSIWIEADYNDEDMLQELRYKLLQLTEVLAYWLWQVTPSLKPHLTQLGPNPIQVKFRVQNLDNWGDQAERDDAVPLEHRFGKQVDKDGISIVIPDSIQIALQGPDNYGERLILLALLDCYGMFLGAYSKPNTLTLKECQRIVNEHAPLGRKKKICMTGTEMDASFDPRYLPPFRTIPTHDIEEQLAGLAIELGSDAPPIGEVLDNSQVVELLQKVVDIYYKRLHSMLSDFNWRSLLERLIGYNEVLWHHQSVVTITTPTTIECYSDVQSHVETLAKQIPDIEKSALAARTLIEIVSAQPPTGSGEVSMDALDTLLAITYHLVNWAMLSDQIHLGILAPKISILSNGRIGVEKGIIDEKMSPFKEEKTRERVERTIEGFQKEFELQAIEEAEAAVSEYDPAFKAEFGLTLTQILDFISSLITIGFGHPTASPHMPLSELKKSLKSDLKWVDENVDLALRLFSLTPRKKWDKAPKGFDEKRDIWPWRYSRRLSYIRRPLIITLESEEEPLVYWGPRHTQNSCRYFVNLVVGGRLRSNDIRSEEMKTLIGSIQNKTGQEFTHKIRQWLEKNSNWVVESEMLIGVFANIKVALPRFS